MIPKTTRLTEFINYAGERIEFKIKRAKRKTLSIAVRPDLSIVVTAPGRASIDAIKAKVIKRAAWIRKQRIYFERFLPPAPPRCYISGETHRYLGRQYRLKVLSAIPESVKLKGQYLRVETPHKQDAKRVRFLLNAWYLEHARLIFSRRLEACLPGLHGRIKEAPSLYLRRMPKRWGSWTQRGAIYLNPELVRAPSSCIDYVVMHELCHLVHGNHGKEFFALLRKVMPDWETRKARLEIAMIS
jgi:predicted metal-dependent hydrolase